MKFRLSAFLLAASVLLFSFATAQAQAPGPGGPPAVGVVHARKQAITETSEFVGRIQATDRVTIVARVTGFLEKQNFVEGSDVKKGDLLYVLEQPPFQADLAAKQAAVDQAQAQLQNAELTFNRAAALLKTAAGQQSKVDDARATMLTDAAQLQAARAQLRQSAINLGYTEIRSPIDGKIGRTEVTIGNVVSPGSSRLTTIVSQDPMYVVFPVSVRAGLDLRQHYADKGGLGAAVIKLRLSDGRIYPQTGTLDFVDNSVSQSTDTIILRGKIPNPIIGKPRLNYEAARELVDGEYVTVLLEGAQPVELLAIPRAAVLSDQQGDYVFTVDAQNKVQQTRVQLGQSTPETATVLSGLSPGALVIVDGLQKVRPGMAVLPGPAAPTIAANPAELKGGGPTPTGASRPRPSAGPGRAAAAER